MSTTTALARIRNQWQFHELVKRRRRFVGWLTAMTLIPYYAFILIAGFEPNILARKLSDNSVINLGWPVGLFLIVGTWALTGLYVYRANGEFDELTAEILARTKQ
jgi:uncharacterized membrane protein (DUF485 family)